MDTSETYSKICEKAEEIQALWFPKEGDFYAYPNELDYGKSDKYIVRVLCNPGALGLGELGQGCYENEDARTGNPCVVVCKFKKAGNIWLPRQEQLQEIIGEGKVDGSYGRILIAMLYLRFSTNGPQYYENFTSLEQIWLAFAMKEKYGKVWDGKSWVNGKTN